VRGNVSRLCIESRRDGGNRDGGNLEVNGPRCDIPAVAIKANKTSTGKTRGAGASYRGVRLQPPVASPRTPLSKLQDAVKAAVAKNHDALSHGK
jgi:hypothetical protein